MEPLKGVNTLLMTPFIDGGEVDRVSLRRVIDHVIDGGANSLVAIGKIGEFSVLQMDERRQVMEQVIDHVAGRVPVGFGIIDAEFEEGLNVARYAKETGGDYVMSRPPVDGDMRDYYARLADMIPVMIYDQGMQGDLSMEDDVAPICNANSNIIAVKVSGMPDRFEQAKQLLTIPCLAGWDFFSLMAYQLGSDGVISGSATLVPADEVRLYELAKQEKWDEARDLYYSKLVPMLNYCTFDPHAYSVCKYFLYYQGLIDDPSVRHPNPDAGPVRRGEVVAILKRLGLLKVELVGK